MKEITTVGFFTYNCSMGSNIEDGNNSLITDHRRQWRECRYVYPVISRRARGLSIGVNLNIDMHCNFNCIYCQIDRKKRRVVFDVIIHALQEELRLALSAAVSGRLWTEERFATTPAGLRRVNDIAFSGDGEPTLIPLLPEAVSAAAEILDEMGLTKEGVGIVIISNATNLGREGMDDIVETLRTHNGRIWAKLDAGTEVFFQKVNRPSGEITLQRIVDDIARVSKSLPIVLQTLMFRFRGRKPHKKQIGAWIGRLEEILEKGGQIDLVQLHTVARPPAESTVSPLPDAQLEEIAAEVRQRLPDLRVDTFYSPSTFTSE